MAAFAGTAGLALWPCPAALLQGCKARAAAPTRDVRTLGALR